MSQNKKIVIGILIVLVIVIGLLVTYKVIKKDVRNENIGSNPIETENHEKDDKDKEITWEEITEDGVDEELLFENTDTKLVTQIVAELQTLAEEIKETKGETENPEIVTVEEWERITNNERYKKVLNMGNYAIKPLYLILSESLDNGEYEYICAKILYELSGFEFDWTNPTDFLEGFNQKIMESKQ